MTSSPLESYLRALARALHDRGYDDPRLVDEAREHLADAVQDGLARGLSRAQAEREAVERFGPPDLIAAQPLPERHPMTAPLDAIRFHWKSIVAATAAAALFAGVMSPLVLPARYRSESVIQVVPQHVSPWSMADPTRQFPERVHSMTQAILSGPRLDRLVKDFGLDAEQPLRRDISVVVLTPEQAAASDGTGMFKVGFQSPDPGLSRKVAERLTSLFIQENLRDHEASPAIGEQFKVIEAPNLPKDPVAPNRAGFTAGGALVGLALSIGALAWRKPRAALP